MLNEPNNSLGQIPEPVNSITNPIEINQEPSSDNLKGSPSQIVTYATTPNILRGFLYLPPGTGPFPAIVYNHGSEPKPGRKPAIANFFVSKGFIIFIPHRRGQGLSQGPYIKDEIQNAGSMANKAQMQVTQLSSQADDVVAAFEYLKKRPDVDLNRLVVMGGSYGGIMTLLTAEKKLGLKAAVSFGGAAMSWNNQVLQERLKQAVDNSVVPIFFLQAENDYNTGPSKVLSAEMEKNNVNGMKPQVKIYPAFGTTHEEGHGKFFGASQVWGQDVMAFLKNYGL